MMDKNFPTWAKWSAQDEDGALWVYEVEPLQHHRGWYENEVGRSVKIEMGDKPDDWKSTLRRCTD